jgi:hypothetical protein
MYTIDLETLKKLVDAYNFLNQVEVKGVTNLQYLYNGLYNLQKIIEDLNKQQVNQKEKGIEVDNTKKGDK